MGGLGGRLGLRFDAFRVGLVTGRLVLVQPFGGERSRGGGVGRQQVERARRHCIRTVGKGAGLAADIKSAVNVQ